MKTSALRWIVAIFVTINLAALPGCKPRPPVGDVPDWAKNIASAGAKKGLQYLLGVAHLPSPDWIVNPAVGLIMGLIFKGGPSPGPTTEQVLAQIQGTLADIENKLDAIAGQLNKIETELAVDTSAIEKQVAIQGMDPYVNHINGLWAQYQALRHADGTWNTDPANLESLALAILDSNNGVFPQLQAMHDLITGENNVSGSTLVAVANASQTLVVSGGESTFDCYMLIENYFGSLLRAQTRGSTLMMEALKYREANTTLTSPLGLYPGTAVDFSIWYQKQIEDEVECFLQQTEALVTATAYPQQGFADFVPGADQIFWRADLIAAWLSTKHRQDSTAKADGQKFMIYRVIGGPSRVAAYGTGFDGGWGKTFRSIQFAASGWDTQYSVPNYVQTDHHACGNLRTGAWPYVEFAPPVGGYNGGVLKDAATISTGVYCADISRLGGGSVSQAYYLNDIPTHAAGTVQFAAVDSAGQTPPPGDNDSMLYGHILDVQHPPAQLMGKWILRLSHSDQNGLGNPLADWLNGSTSPGSQSVYMGVNAWPTWTRRYPYGGDDTGWVSGSFNHEYSLEGHYLWAGAGSPTLQLDWSGNLNWQVVYDGTPASHTCGLNLWMGSGTGHDTSSNLGYQNIGNGTDGLTGSCKLAMAPGTEFYMSFGPHMQLDWGNQELHGSDEWHHWQANYNFSLTGLTLTLPQ